jgi:hypothetical protein
MTMHANNGRFDAAKRKARELLRTETDRERQDDLKGIIDDINAGVWISDQRMRDMEMWSIRNPGFPGDMVGRPDDDFDDDDDDDDDDEDTRDQSKTRPPV